jgi:hypothetical protein
MAHSHQQHRNAGRKRVQHLLASGGCAGAHMPHKKRGGSIRLKEAAEPDRDVMAEGGKPKRRYARGGKTRHQTNIAIVMPHHAPPMAAGAPAGPMAPPPLAAMPPGAPLAGGAPMAGPFRKGGKVSIIGDDAQNDVSSYKPAHFTKKNQGGSLDDSYGSATGMSRRAEYRKLKGKR